MRNLVFNFLNLDIRIKYFMNSNLKSLANFGDFDEFCPLSLLLFILIIFKYIIGSMQNSFTVHAINQHRLLANRVSTRTLLEDISF